MKTSKAKFTFFNKNTYEKALNALNECGSIVSVEGKEYKILHKYVIILSDVDGDGEFAREYGKNILSGLGLVDEKDGFNYNYSSMLMIYEDGRCIWG